MPRQPKGLTYRITWVDARDPLFTYTKTYKTVVPAIRQDDTPAIGDASLYTDRLKVERFDCTVHEGRLYKPDMVFVGMCFENLSNWRKAYARFHESKVQPSRKTRRFDPYGPLSFDLHVSTDWDRNAVVNIHLQPYVNGKVPFTSAPD
jgi:hypothetical protein